MYNASIQILNITCTSFNSVIFWQRPPVVLSKESVTILNDPSFRNYLLSDIVFYYSGIHKTPVYSAVAVHMACMNSQQNLVLAYCLLLMQGVATLQLDLVGVAAAAH